MASTQPIDENGLTPYQEEFAQQMAKGLLQADAHEQSYKDGNYSRKQRYEEGSKLMSNPKVFQRVESLRAANAERNAVTVESITRELNEQVVLASGEKQHAAAIGGIEKKAKLHGLMVDRTHQTGEVKISVVKYGETA